MTEAVERLVNVALFLAAARGPVSAERIRAEVTGYPEGQDEAAFLRMFERDKDELRATGLAIESTPDGRYQLDAGRTFVAGLDLSSDEEAALRAAATVFLSDPSFPFVTDLRFALAKISGGSDVDVPAAAHLADERPGTQGATVSAPGHGLRRVQAGDVRLHERSGDERAAHSRALRTLPALGAVVPGGQGHRTRRDPRLCGSPHGQRDRECRSPAHCQTSYDRLTSTWPSTSGFPFQYGAGTRVRRGRTVRPFRVVARSRADRWRRRDPGGRGSPRSGMSRRATERASRAGSWRTGPDWRSSLREEVAELVRSGLAGAADAHA
jgi:hypothetical protein